MSGNHRVAAVTGLGVVAPGGIGTPAFWNLLVEGRSATRPISLFDAAGFRSRIAAECDFDPAAHGLGADAAARMDRAVQFAIVSAREAVADSGLDLPAPRRDRVAAVIGSAVGCTMRLEEHYVSTTE